jgi:hypothetical protein
VEVHIAQVVLQAFPEWRCVLMAQDACAAQHRD